MTKNHLFALNAFRSYLWLLVFVLMGSNAFTQNLYRLHIKVVSVPATHSDDSIFLAGSFNNRNLTDKAYQLVKNDSTYSIGIDSLKEGSYHFRFTRGDLKKLEVNESGTPVDSRFIKLSSDTSIEYSIKAWQDDFPEITKIHTASGHVQVIDSAFFIPQLNQTTKVWIYLPQGYAAKKNRKRYPVLYMQDGQNVFDQYTAGSLEWGVDECLDSMIENGAPPCIVVAIDCGPNRMTEYNPYYSKHFGEGEGTKYVDFLAGTLKPFIDRHYRTLSSRQNTIVAGSSMGGLISYYALLSRPRIFGKAGVFSPAFWTAPKIKQLTDSVGSAIDAKIFFYMGEPEGRTYVSDMTEIADSLAKISDAIIYTVIDPLGHHDEQAWRKWFPEFYNWITADGFNSPVTIEK